MKFAAIADWAESASFPVTFMCHELGVSTSGYYKWRTQAPSDRATTDATLSAVIRHHFDRLAGNPGVRRMHAELAATGHRVGRKRVWRLMRAVGLQGRHPRAWKRTTVPGERPVPAPDLIGRDFTADRVNEKWCGDITYIKTWDGWAYLATVIDLYSRKVVGWALDTHMRTDLVTDALSMAITHRRPRRKVIFHSDRGTQYTSKEFAKFCKNNRIRRSLGRTGICYDNAVAESFFATYKKELIHTRPWPELASLKKHTFRWIEEYYNQTAPTFHPRLLDTPRKRTRIHEYPRTRSINPLSTLSGTLQTALADGLAAELEGLGYGPGGIGVWADDRGRPSSTRGAAVWVALTDQRRRLDTRHPIEP
ncbi:IS3 family transposase [Granulicoccus sp. GXG6511]|uniref:IS3 family transposase n=1 Tax=Granulicoccus sp. GXG6511 TaxID=3381351 RepID=UPI003D7D2FB7